ncbi:MAG TPA: metal-dependent hydrolase, partial [Dongiaceae bacterium]|nr:metal-dependent hydrolase [Dongiaceae bacterium]
VAFDVYQDQVGSYWVRTSEMALTTVLFTFFSALHTYQLMKNDTEARQHRQGLGKRLSGLWKHRQILQELGKHYVQYYRPDFHPSQKDSSFLRRKGLKKLQEWVGDKAAIPAGLLAQG